MKSTHPAVRTTRALSVAALAFAAFAFGSGSALAQAQKLKLSIFTSDREPTYVNVWKPWVETINKEAAGAIEIDLFPNGALGRSPLQQAQMVLDGVADMALVIVSYTPGRFQENEVLELPGVFRDQREATLVFSRMVSSGKIRGYEEFFPLGLMALAPSSLHGRFPINTLADVRGKKFRSAGAMEGESLKSIGIVPVGLPINEISEAIARGTIDGSTSYPAALIDFGIARVTTSDYFASIGIVPMALLMNRKKLESLPKAGQDAIRKYSGEYFAARYIEKIVPYNESLVKQLQADPKRKVVFPSQADQNEMQASFKKVVDAWAGKTPRNQELLRLLQAEVATVRSAR
jgi:TRAP-type C4-dicarboxylate transport system substrate-binding protein